MKKFFQKRKDKKGTVPVASVAHSTDNIHVVVDNGQSALPSNVSTDLGAGVGNGNENLQDSNVKVFQQHPPSSPPPQHQQSVSSGSAQRQNNNDNNANGFQSSISAPVTIGTVSQVSPQPLDPHAIVTSNNDAFSVTNNAEPHNDLRNPHTNPPSQTTATHTTASAPFGDNLGRSNSGMTGTTFEYDSVGSPAITNVSSPRGAFTANSPALSSSASPHTPAAATPPALAPKPAYQPPPPAQSMPIPSYSQTVSSPAMPNTWNTGQYGGPPMQQQMQPHMPPHMPQHQQQYQQHQQYQQRQPYQQPYNVNQSYPIIMAIDWGTTFSSMAYAYQQDGEVHEVSTW
jgi:hypothetical protein